MRRGSLIHHAHGTRPDGARIRATEFNPGFGGPYRFSHFGEPVVPSWYGGENDAVALCETLIRDLPSTGGRLVASQYRHHQISVVRTRRTLRLVELRGKGRLLVSSQNVTACDSDQYDRSVKWAEAAHDVRPMVDGIIWTSYRFDQGYALVLFGDRVEEVDLEPVRVTMDFSISRHRDELAAFGRDVNVRVLTA